MSSNNLILNLKQRFIRSISEIHYISFDIQFKPLSYSYCYIPIEIALGIDADGMTTARKLYEFLEMDESHYSRWVKSNITDNPFAEENVDFEVLAINGENPKGGRPTQDFKLTANFAKKLSMQGKTDRAEQAREYFIRVEDKLKEVVVNNSVNDSILKNQKLYSEQYQTNKVKHYTSSTPIPKIKDEMDYTKEIELSKPYELPDNYMDIQKELIAIFLK